LGRRGGFESSRDVGRSSIERRRLSISSSLEGGDLRETGALVANPTDWILGASRPIGRTFESEEFARVEVS